MLDHCPESAGPSPLSIALASGSPRATINCKISAQSVVDGRWGARLDALLGDDRTIGGRLILDVTGAAGLTGFRRARAFASAMRSRGILLALSGFDGACRDGLRAALIEPDIIKIGDGWLEGTRNRGSVGALQRLVRFARQHAPCVAIEGAGHPDHRSIADACGIDCAEGAMIAQVLRINPISEFKQKFGRGGPKSPKKFLDTGNCGSEMSL